MDQLQTGVTAFQDWATNHQDSLKEIFAGASATMENATASIRTLASKYEGDATDILGKASKSFKETTQSAKVWSATQQSDVHNLMDSASETAKTKLNDFNRFLETSTFGGLLPKNDTAEGGADGSTGKSTNASFSKKGKGKNSGSSLMSGTAGGGVTTRTIPTDPAASSVLILGVGGMTTLVLCRYLYNINTYELELRRNILWHHYGPAATAAAAAAENASREDAMISDDNTNHQEQRPSTTSSTSFKLNLPSQQQQASREDSFDPPPSPTLRQTLDKWMDLASPVYHLVAGPVEGLHCSFFDQWRDIISRRYPLFVRRASSVATLSGGIADAGVGVVVQTHEEGGREEEQQQQQQQRTMRNTESYHSGTSDEYVYIHHEGSPSGGKQQHGSSSGLAGGPRSPDPRHSPRSFTREGDNFTGRDEPNGPVSWLIDTIGSIVQGLKESYGCLQELLLTVNYEEEEDQASLSPHRSVRRFQRQKQLWSIYYCSHAAIYFIQAYFLSKTALYKDPVVIVRKDGSPSGGSSSSSDDPTKKGEEKTELSWGQIVENVSARVVHLTVTGVKKGAKYIQDEVITPALSTATPSTLKTVLEEQESAAAAATKDVHSSLGGGSLPFFRSLSLLRFAMGAIHLMCAADGFTQLLSSLFSLTEEHHTILEQRLVRASRALKPSLLVTDLVFAIWSTYLAAVLPMDEVHVHNSPRYTVIAALLLHLPFLRHFYFDDSRHSIHCIGAVERVGLYTLSLVKHVMLATGFLRLNQNYTDLSENAHRKAVRLASVLTMGYHSQATTLRAGQPTQERNSTALPDKTREYSPYGEKETDREYSAPTSKRSFMSEGGGGGGAAATNESAAGSKRVTSEARSNSAVPMYSARTVVSEGADSTAAPLLNAQPPWKEALQTAFVYAEKGLAIARRVTWHISREIRKNMSVHFLLSFNIVHDVGLFWTMKPGEFPAWFSPLLLTEMTFYTVFLVYRELHKKSVLSAVLPEHIFAGEIRFPAEEVILSKRRARQQKTQVQQQQQQQERGLVDPAYNAYSGNNNEYGEEGLIQNSPRGDQLLSTMTLRQ